MNVVLDAVKIAVLVFVLAVLQVAATPQFTPFGGGPDLIVILVVALALWRGVEAAAVAGFAGGLLLDAMLFQHLGMQSIVYIGCAWIVASYAPRREAGPGMLEPPPPPPLLWLIAGAATVQVGNAILHVLLGSGVAADVIVWRQMVPSVLQTTILALPLLPLIRRLFRPASPLNRVHRVAPA